MHVCIYKVYMYVCVCGRACVHAYVCMHMHVLLSAFFPTEKCWLNANINGWGGGTVAQNVFKLLTY